MDWLVWITLIAVLVVLVFILRKMYIMDDRVKVVAKGLDQFRVRVGEVKQHRTGDKVPHVDSRARTTVRDSGDIPVRGARISTAVHRKVYDAGDADDAELQ